MIVYVVCTTALLFVIHVFLCYLFVEHFIDCGILHIFAAVINANKINAF